MPAPLRNEDDDDLYDDEFDFVDDEDDAPDEAADGFGAGIALDPDAEEGEGPPKRKRPAKKKAARKTAKKKADDGGSDGDGEKPPKRKKAVKKKAAKKKAKKAEPVEEVEPVAEPAPSEAAAETPATEAPAAPPAEEAKPAPPATDHIVRVFEHGKLKRTIDREFTAEDAEAYAAEYTRTGKAYGLEAQAASKETVDL